jgi:sulfoxide reductase heme-binding subunit YedZ
MNPLARALLRHPFVAVAAVLAVEATVSLLAFGAGIEGLQALTRYSGRVGLLIFAVVFACGPLMRLSPGPLLRAVVSRRRQLGLAFGAHHLAHLAILLAYLRASGRDLDPARAAGGVLAYVVLLVMMGTSSDASVRALGPANWRRLHLAGLWYFWFAFLLTYVPRLQGRVPEAGGGMGEFVACASLVAGLAALRLASMAAGRRAGTSAPH